MERSIKEFNFSPTVHFYLVINEEHSNYISKIEDVLSTYENKYKILATEDTQGQAETGYIGCKDIPNDEPIFFFNGDTILKNRDLSSMVKDLKTGISGAIDAFIENRNHFSFIKISQKNLVEEIAEKVVISNYATTGLYGFSNKKEYLDYYKDFSTSKEKYISDIYKIMLSENKKIKGYVNSETSDTIILGTPEEYFSNKHKL